MKDLWKKFTQLPSGVKAAFTWMFLFWLLITVVIPTMGAVLFLVVGTFIAVGRLIKYGVDKS